jgi:hypothetical protein
LTPHGLSRGSNAEWYEKPRAITSHPPRRAAPAPLCRSPDPPYSDISSPPADIGPGLGGVDGALRIEVLELGVVGPPGGVTVPHNPFGDDGRRLVGRLVVGLYVAVPHQRGGPIGGDPSGFMPAERIGVPPFQGFMHW